jgi:hypothetical protein
MKSKNNFLKLNIFFNFFQLFVRCVTLRVKTLNFENSLDSLKRTTQKRVAQSSYKIRKIYPSFLIACLSNQLLAESIEKTPIIIQITFNSLFSV